MNTLVNFQLRAPDLRKRSSMAELPINRYAKAVINSKLTASRHNKLFFCFYFLHTGTGITLLSA